MRKLSIVFCFFLPFLISAQASDFASFDFTQVDQKAKKFKSRRLNDLNNITYNLTKDYDTDIEKFRAIFIWVTHNIRNDYKLYAKNSRKRKRFEEDSIKLEKWNSKFKKIIFKKLIRKKRTICTGYAYLLKEMSDIVGIKAEIVHGFGRTADVDVESLTEPNHSWNVVKLNDKWYLCDPTWAAGISYPDQGKFVFSYNDGLFLTEPELFLFNHLPVYSQYSLTSQSLSIKEFASLPLLYNDSYLAISSHISPKKMNHELLQGDSLRFSYSLKSGMNPNKVKLILAGSVSERTVYPETTFDGKILDFSHTFSKRGFVDVHVYFDKKIVASYTVDVKRKTD